MTLSKEKKGEVVWFLPPFADHAEKGVKLKDRACAVIWD